MHTTLEIASRFLAATAPANLQIDLDDWRTRCNDALQMAEILVAEFGGSTPTYQRELDLQDKPEHVGHIARSIFVGATRRGVA